MLLASFINSWQQKWDFAWQFLAFGVWNSDVLQWFVLFLSRGIRFMCCFRFKLWWMTQRMGSSGNEVPYETQFMLLEGPSSDMYTVVLPIIEGPFRASLQGSDNNELALCLESGKLLSYFSFFFPSNCFPLTTPPALLTFFSLVFFCFCRRSKCADIAWVACLVHQCRQWPIPSHHRCCAVGVLTILFLNSGLPHF